MAESRLPADGRVHAFGRPVRAAGQPVRRRRRGGGTPRPAVVEEVRRQAAAGTPFDLVHSHLQVVGPAVLAALGPTRPPALHTLHWDLQRNEEFYATFDGGGRVFFAGVSRAQVARGPAALRRQMLGVVPLAVPLPTAPPLGRDERAGFVLVLGRLCALKGVDTAVRACRAAGLPAGAGRPGRAVPRPRLARAALADPAGTWPGPPRRRLVHRARGPALDGEAVALGGHRRRPRRRTTCCAARGRCSPRPLAGARRDRGLRGARGRHAGGGMAARLPALAAGRRGHRLPGRRRGGVHRRPGTGSTSSTRRPAPGSPAAGSPPPSWPRGYERLYADVLRGRRPGSGWAGDPRRLPVDPA